MIRLVKSDDLAVREGRPNPDRLAGLEFPGICEDQVLAEPLAETFLADVERVTARHPHVPSAVAQALLSEIRRLGWELENAKKAAGYWKRRCGGPGDGVADRL